MSRLMRVCLGMVIALAGLPLPAHAQTPQPAIELPYSLIDAESGLSLRCPADWRLARAAAGAIAFTADRAELRVWGPARFGRSADTASTFLSRYWREVLGDTDVDLSIPPAALMLGETPAAFRVMNEGAATTVYYVLALGEAQHVVARLTLDAPDLPVFQPLAEAILATAAAVPTGYTLDVDVTGLPNAAATADGAYTFAYPDGWGLTVNGIARLDYPAADPALGTLTPGQAVIRVSVREAPDLLTAVTRSAYGLADFVTGTLNNRPMATWESTGGGWDDAWSGVVIDLGGGAYGEVSLFTMGGQVRGFAPTVAQIAASLRPALPETYTYPAAPVAFDFPAGWVIQEDAPEIVRLMNDPTVDFPDLRPGQVVMQIGADTRAGMPRVGPDDGIWEVAAWFTLDSGVPFREPYAILIDGRQAARTDFLGARPMSVVVFMLDADWFVLLTLSAGEDDDMTWIEPTLLDIAASVRLTD